MRRRWHQPVLVLAGFLVGGWLGLAVAVLALVAVHRSRRLALWLPVVLLAVAALTTVVPEVPTSGSLRQTFATDRPLAADAGLAAGIALLVLVVDTAVHASGRRRAEGGDDGDADPRPAWPAVIRRHAALLGVGLLAMVLRLLVGGSGLSEAESAAVQALRDGEGPTVAVPPVAVALDAVSPLGSTALTALVAGVLVIALTVLAQRLAGRPAGAAVPTAGGLALLVALTWASPLAVTVALLGFTGALLAVAGEDPPPGAVALAGFGLGLAGLARPEMALLGITVLVWAAIRPRPLRPSAFVGLVLATGISVVPWVVHVHHRTGTPGLASPLTDALTALGSVAGGPVVAGVSALALVAAAAVGVGQRQWLGDQALGLLPLLAGAVLAGGLLVGDPDVLAGYPAVPLAVVVLARSTPATITEAGPWRT